MLPNKFLNDDDRHWNDQYDVTLHFKYSQFDVRRVWPFLKILDGFLIDEFHDFTIKFVGVNYLCENVDQLTENEDRYVLKVSEILKAVILTIRDYILRA